MERALSKILCLLFIVSISSISAVNAEELMQKREEINKEILRIQADAKKLQQAIRAGSERSSLCAHCHGADGNSKKPDIPNLAEQNPGYIIEQIGKFRDGQRKNFVMQTLARDFTREDEINLALYYNSRKLKTLEVDAAQVDKGSNLFKQKCVLCHGESGRGEKGYARVAGQQLEYMMMTLKRFRANAGASNNADQSQRSDARMEQVSQYLTDEDISALANYIAQIK